MQSLELLMFGVALVIIYVLVINILPQGYKKYAAWSWIERRTYEERIEEVINRFEDKEDGKANIIRKLFSFFSAFEYAKEAKKIHWDVESIAPMLLYGCVLIGITFGWVLKSPVAMLLFGLGGLWFPWFYLADKRDKYERIIEDQVEALIQTTASGYAIHKNITVALEEASGALESPLREMWEQMVSEYLSGHDLDSLLRDFEKKVSMVPEFKIFSSIIRVVEKSGGDASQTMKDVAEVIQRNRVLKEELKTELANARQAHRFNIILAVIIVFVFRFMQADMFNNLMDTIIGQGLIISMGLYCFWSLHKVKQLTKL